MCCVRSQRRSQRACQHAQAMSAKGAAHGVFARASSSNACFTSQTLLFLWGPHAPPPLPCCCCLMLLSGVGGCAWDGIAVAVAADVSLLGWLLLGVRAQLACTGHERLRRRAGRGSVEVGWSWRVGRARGRVRAAVTAHSNTALATTAQCTRAHNQLHVAAAHATTNKPSGAGQASSLALFWQSPHCQHALILV